MPSNQVSPGMTISLNGKIYRVESCVRVSATKGVPFIKTTLKNLMSDEMIEKNFKVDQKIDEVSLKEKRLEYLYQEGKDFLFLDIDNFDQVQVSATIMQDKANYLKEGTQITSMFYGDTIFSVELPQFLELAIIKTESQEAKVSVSNATKIGVLETGAKVEVPLFIESGDIIKVDTHNNEYIQRI